MRVITIFYYFQLKKYVLILARCYGEGGMIGSLLAWEMSCLLLRGQPRRQQLEWQVREVGSQQQAPQSQTNKKHLLAVQKNS